jgi:hypothetical protein
MAEQTAPTTESDTNIGPAAAPAAKPRRCLMCKEKFPSEWAGERICKRCRQTAAWRQG